MRTKFLDPDYRRQPKTDYFCCRCQKDLPPDKPARTVHLINGGPTVLHPEDEAQYKPIETSGDMGCFPIGPECARILGREWTHAPSAQKDAIVHNKNCELGDNHKDCPACIETRHMACPENKSFQRAGFGAN